MNTTPRALLLVMMEPAPAVDEEFNDWYDFEHLPQRSDLPGFESASRWICTDGWPRYAALYGLESAEALRTVRYLATSGDNATPWSKRLSGRLRGVRRIVATIVDAKSAEGSPLIPEDVPKRDVSSHATVDHAKLLIVGYSQSIDATAVLRILGEVDRSKSSKMAVSIYEQVADDKIRSWVLANCSASLTADFLRDCFGSIDGCEATLFNLYVPYIRNELTP